MPRATPSPRWSSQLTHRGLLALRVWLVLAVAVLGLGTGGRPIVPALAQLAEQGVQGSPHGPASPNELPEKLPLRSKSEAKEAKETKETKDASDSEDSSRRRAPASVLSLAPTVDLRLAASEARLRFAASHPTGPGRAPRSQLHNRGPPLA